VRVSVVSFHVEVTLPRWSVNMKITSFASWVLTATGRPPKL
jgi:hypothetical protein